MVDFNNEGTVSTPAINIVRILVLQARANVFEAWERYNSDDFNGGRPNIGTVRARLITWFEEHQAYLKRSLPKVKKKEDDLTYLELVDIIYKYDNFSKIEVIKIMHFLNELLDKLQINKLDLRKTYDKQSWESDNKAHGY